MASIEVSVKISDWGHSPALYAGDVTLRCVMDGGTEFDFAHSFSQCDTVEKGIATSAESLINELRGLIKEAEALKIPRS